MFPIRDHNPSGSTPWVTWALILANALVFLIELGVAGNPGAEAQFLRDWALFPAAVTQGGEFGGILSSMFLHAGFMHLAGNMLFLWIFGDNLEDALGHAGFLFVYLASGVAAALAQIAAFGVSMRLAESLALIWKRTRISNSLRAFRLRARLRLL